MIGSHPGHCRVEIKEEDISLVMIVEGVSIFRLLYFVHFREIVDPNI